MSDLPLWRSMLFVPATAERFVAKAHTRGADAIIVDLEDAVAPSEKPRARSLVADVARTVGQAGADVLVRINRPLRMAIPDLEAASGADVDAVMIPKAESASHVRLLAEAMEDLERERGLAPGHTRIVALIETTEGIHNVREIAAASPRMAGITLGGEDFAEALGLPDVVPATLVAHLQQVQLAARDGGILPLGYAGGMANFSDLEAYRADLLAARALGFQGGSCIHPAQVAFLNESFAPTRDEIEKAERIVAAYDKALAEGLGAIELDGRMIDVPVANRARNVLARRDRIARRR